MKCLFLLSIILPVFALCQQSPNATSSSKPALAIRDTHIESNPFPTIADIPLPPGYERVAVTPSSFEMYLRSLPLKKDKIVHLFNGQPKSNQDAQFAVIDLSIGNKDLQQCADAIMRLRAEYFYKQKQFDQIRFTDNSNAIYAFNGPTNRNAFDAYLDKVFSYCGTLSLERQLIQRSHMDDAQIGDVLIKGGSPGHAMLIVDMARNKQGEKIYLLSQGYMPAQEIHVVINPNNQLLSPWYIVDNESPIHTPEWTFQLNQLKHW